MKQSYNEVWPQTHTATNEVNPMSGCGKEYGIQKYFEESTFKSYSVNFWPQVHENISGSSGSTH